MHEWKKLTHVRWDCKYHVVFIPKYRKKVFYGNMRRKIGQILRELCDQRGIELLEGNAMADHVGKEKGATLPFKGVHTRNKDLRQRVETSGCDAFTWLETADRGSGWQAVIGLGDRQQ